MPARVPLVGYAMGRAESSSDLEGDVGGQHDSEHGLAAVRSSVLGGGLANKQRAPRPPSWLPPLPLERVPIPPPGVIDLTVRRSSAPPPLPASRDTRRSSAPPPQALFVAPALPRRSSAPPPQQPWPNPTRTTAHPAAAPMWPVAVPSYDAPFAPPRTTSSFPRTASSDPRGSSMSTMPPVLRDYRDFDVEIGRSRRAPKVLFFVALFSAAVAAVALRDRFPAEIREHIPAVDLERAHEMAWNAKVWVIAHANAWRGMSTSTSTPPAVSGPPAPHGGATPAGPAPAIAGQPPEVSVQALPVASTLKASKPMAPRALDVPPAPGAPEATHASSSPATHAVEAPRAAAPSPGWHRIQQDPSDDPSDNATEHAVEAPRAAAPSPGWHRIQQEPSDDHSDNAAADKGSTDDTSTETPAAPPPAKLVAAPPPPPGSLDDLIRKEVEKEQAAKH
jgi:hypothetical protein